MQKNESVPPLERLDREEFTIDFKERDRLLAIADERVKQVQTSIETENLKKRVIRNRIKVVILRKYHSHVTERMLGFHGSHWTIYKIISP